MAQKPAAKKAAKKPAKKQAAKRPAAKKGAKKARGKSSNSARKVATKRRAAKRKATPTAAAYGATLTAVKQVEQAYKAIKSSGAAIERSLNLSKLVDAVSGGASLRRLEKMRARLQAAQGEYRRAYEATLKQMEAGKD